MKETRGVIQYNRNTKCIVRSIVCMQSLRQWWDGPVTMVLEGDYPKSYEDVVRSFNIDIIHSENPDTGVMVRAVEICRDLAPYDRNLWLDTDTVVVGKIDEMFDYLDDYEFAIPHFAGWWSDGSGIAKRIKRYKGIASDEVIEKALEHNPAINCGIYSFRKNASFLDIWLDLAHRGDHKMFIPDEVAFQTLYPSHRDKVFIGPRKFGVSVIHDPTPKTEDKRIIHYHGQKHLLDAPYCKVWKDLFEEMRKNNTGNINDYLYLADKRLKEYLGGAKSNDVTIVTACDEKYIECLKLTFPNWRKYKSIDRYPVIVFVNGIDLSDSRLDFLRLPNVQLIPWSMDNVDDHREEMLSAFILGTSKYVRTSHWLKLDADSFATNYEPLFDDDMKELAFCGHKWSYSWAKHIKQLDEWAKTHRKREIRTAPPMYDESRVKGRRFYHEKRRTISFIQLQKTKFTQWCAKMAGGKRLPVPSHDTFMFFIADRFKNEYGTKNFKSEHGFDQGKGSDLAGLARKLQEVDEKNGEECQTENQTVQIIRENNPKVEQIDTVDFIETSDNDEAIFTPEIQPDIQLKTQPENQVDRSKCGVIMYNKGTACIIRSLVSIYSLKKWWDGSVTLFVEDSPQEYINAVKSLGVNVIETSSDEKNVFIRSIELCKQTPYEYTMWLDADTLVYGKIDEMFDYLDDSHYLAIPHYINWWSDGSVISKRIEQFREIIGDEWINKALDHKPAINCGVFSFKKGIAFLDSWLSLAKKGAEKDIEIPDEVAFQILYPANSGIYVAPTKFNVGVHHVHQHQEIDDRRILHYHGLRHVLDEPYCRPWKETFKEMINGNIANIKSFLQFASDRLVEYIKGMGDYKNITVVTACDDVSLNHLLLTFPNWIKYKKIDRYPVMIFVNNVEMDDPRLEVLQLPNVTIIPWSMPSSDSHNEEMESAYVFGVAEHVKTDYWFKISPYAYAVNDSKLIDEEMKDYSFCGHKWKYSMSEHIVKLDEWAKTCPKAKIKKAEPMFDATKVVDKRKYIHDKMRTNSFVQMHRTSFTRFCAEISGGKIPVPSEDTYLFYVCDRFKNHYKAIDFKKSKGIYDAKKFEKLKQKLAEVERNNS